MEKKTELLLLKINAFFNENGTEPLMHLSDNISSAERMIYLDFDEMQTALSVDRKSIYVAAEFLQDNGFCVINQNHKCGFYLIGNN